MDEAAIKKEFERIINQRGIGSELGISRADVANYKRRANIKNMLYILYLANKLNIKDGSTSEKK